MHGYQCSAMFCGLEVKVSVNRCIARLSYFDFGLSVEIYLMAVVI